MQANLSNSGLAVEAIMAAAGQVAIRYLKRHGGAGISRTKLVVQDQPKSTAALANRALQQIGLKLTKAEQNELEVIAEGIYTSDELDQYMAAHPERVKVSQEELLAPIDIERRFDISRQTLGHWRAKNDVIGFKYMKDRYRYPAEQFLGHKQIVEGIREIVEIAPTCASAWSWLTHANGRLGNERPIDLLKAGKSDVVIAAAEFQFAP